MLLVHFVISLELYMKSNMLLTTVLNVSDQALVRAGVQIKEEKEMVRMENTGKHQHTN